MNPNFEVTTRRTNPRPNSVTVNVNVLMALVLVLFIFALGWFTLNKVNDGEIARCISIAQNSDEWLSERGYGDPFDDENYADIVEQCEAEAQYN